MNFNHQPNFNKLDKKQRAKRISIYILCGLVLIGSFVLLYRYEFSPIGRVSFEVSVVYKQGEPLAGDLRFRIKEGELVPYDSLINVKYGEQTKTFALKDLVSDNTIEGNYYAEDSQISGEGKGYGAMGSKVIEPTVKFKMLVYNSGSGSGNSDDENNGGDGGRNEEPVLTEGSESETPSQDATALDESTGSGEQTTTTEQTSASDSSSSEGSSTDSAGESSTPSSSESSGEDSGGITGAAVSENEFEVEGQVSIGNDFTYNLEEGQSAKIVEGSVSIDGEKADDNIVSLAIEDSEARVSTQYFINKEGFGKEFLGDFAKTLYINIADLGFVATEPGFLDVSLEYNGAEISSSKTEVDVAGVENEKNVTPENRTIFLIRDIPSVRISLGGSETINLSEYFDGADLYSMDVQNISVGFDGSLMTLTPDIGFKGSRKGIVVARSGEESLESNEFLVLVSSGAVSIKTTKEKAKVGENIAVKKEIDLGENKESLSVEIPRDALNVKVEEFNKEGNSVETEENVPVTGSLISGEVVTEVQLNKKGGLNDLWSKIQKTWKDFVKSITGRTIYEGSSDSASGVDLTLTPNAKTEKVVVSFEVPAAEKTEEKIQNGKKVIISGKDSLGQYYNNLIAFTNLDKPLPANSVQRLKVYWIVPVADAGEIAKTEIAKEPNKLANEEIVKAETSDEYLNDTNSSNMTQEKTNLKQGEEAQYVRQEVAYDAYDLDEDGKFDYIEWIVPHLSNQTYEVVIEVTKAEHLDENRTFVSDVYDSVRALDGSWSETIPANDYVRVTFEIPLDSTRDITLYPRTVNGTPKIEVYEKDGNETIASFDSLIDNQYNKVYLINLGGTQDTFDLKILNGSIELDHIIDPAGSMIITLNSPANYSTGNSLSPKLNVSVNNSLANTMNVTFWNKMNSISTGNTHTCGIISNGSAMCWGLGTSGQLGNGPGTTSNNSVYVNTTNTFVAISAGNTHTCGIIPNGSAMCWGAGTQGQLGYGGTTQQNNPVYVNITNLFVAISAETFSGAGSHSCGITTDGRAMCWGYGFNGQLGIGNTSNSRVPIYVNTTNTFVAISASGSRSCGIISNGSAMCWGMGTSGKLGYGGTSQQNNPVYVNTTNTFVAISAGSSHTCGIISNGSAICWGLGTSGQLGNGPGTSSNNPVYVNTTNTFVAISTGSAHTCGIIPNGSAMCWGLGTSGQLGNGPGTTSNNSVYVNTTNTFVAISTGSLHTCGIIPNGSAMCWGNGTSGQLGDGPGLGSNNPVYVNTTNLFPNETIKVGNNSNIASGSSTTITWSGLRSNSTYFWSTTADDGAGILHSLIWVFTTIASTVQNESEITTCGNLTLENTTYYLQNSVSTNGTCFNITANNVTLDCQNWNNGIVYGNQSSWTEFYGIYSSGNYTTIRNCQIQTGNATIAGLYPRYGIYLINNYNGRIENANLSINRWGIQFDSSSNNNFSMGVIASSNLGIYLEKSSDNAFSGLNLTDIYVSSAIYFDGSSNNSFLNMNINRSHGGIHVEDDGSPFNTNNNVFSNLVITNTNSSGYDLEVVCDEQDHALGNYLIDTPIANYSFDPYDDAAGISFNFKDTRYGEINYLGGHFNMGMAVTGTNLSNDVRIGNNSVFVNSAILGFNKSANVTLYNIGDRGFTTPTILKDGVACGLSCYNFTPLNASTIVFNVSSWSNYSIGEGATNLLTQCQNLTSENTTYYLQNSVSTTGTCFNILADNITLDLNGFNITGDNSTATESGVYIDGYHSITVKNGGIYQFGRGVYISGDSNTVTNLTIRVRSNFEFASSVAMVFINLGTNNNIINNVFDNSSTFNNPVNLYGVYVEGQNNSVVGNSINFPVSDCTDPLGCIGVYLGTGSHSVIENRINVSTGIRATSASRIINNTFSSNRYSLYIEGIDNFIEGGLMENSRQDAIFLEGITSDNNNFTNINITNTNSSYYDIRFDSEGIDGTRLVDMPDIDNYTFTGAGGTIIVKDTAYGEIKFLQSVNGSGTNLTADILIGNNSVTVRSNVNSGLNKSANVTLYGIGNRGFTTPTILKDGVACGSSCYNFTPLNASTIVFNVSSWSNYSIGESGGAGPREADTTAPAINFTGPTASSGTTQTTATAIPVNVSSTDASDHYTLVDFDNDLILWLRMDDVNGSGEPTDISSYSNNGTKVGEANQTNSGYFGKGFSFDGNGGYIYTGALMGPQQFTMSSWFKTNTSSGGKIIGFGSSQTEEWGSYDKHIYMNNEGRIIFGVDNYGLQVINSTNTYNDGLWHQAIVTSGTSGSSLYIDGTLVANDTISAADGSTGYWRIGGGTLAGWEFEPTSYYFNGSIDEVLIFDRVLSSTEVQSLYNASANKYYNNFTELADGVHTFTGYAVDTAGNKNQTETRNVTVDVNAPTIDILYPDNGNYNYGVSELNYSAFDAGSGLGDESCSYTLKSPGYQTMYGITMPCNNFTGLSSHEGSNTWIVDVMDLNGHTNSSNVTFLVDTIYPSINFTSPTPSSGTQSGNSIYVNLSTNDTNQHYAFSNFDNNIKLWLRMEEVDGDGNPIDSSSYSNNGTKVDYAIQTDAGKFGKGFSFDVGNGQINVAGLNNGNGYEGAAFDISLWFKTGSDGSLVSDYFASFCPEFPCSPTTHSGWDLTIINGKLEWTGYKSTRDEEFTLSFSGNTLVNDSLWHNVVLHYTGYRNVSTYLDGQLEGVTPDAVQQGYTGWSSDNGRTFNIGAGSALFTGTIDEVLLFTNALRAQDIKALYNASANKYYHNFTSLADGTHTFAGYAVDIAGNRNQTEQRSVVIDSIAPGINFTGQTPANGSTQTGTSIYVNLSTNDTNQHYAFADFDRSLRYWYRMENVNGTKIYDDSSYGANATKYGNVNQTDNGYFGKGFNLYNISGSYLNLGYSVGEELSCQWPDYCDIPFTFSTWIKTNSDGTLVYDYDQSAIAGWGIYVDNGKVMFKIGPSNLTGTTNVADGQWKHLAVIYNGSSGGTVYLNGNVEVTGSTARLAYGQDYFSDLDYINATVDEVMFFNRQLNLSEIQSLYNASAYRYYNNFTGLAVGQHNFTGYAVDIAGNKNQTETRSLTIDSTGPAVNLIAPGNGTTVDYSMVSFNATFSDSSGLSNATFYLWEIDPMHVGEYGQIVILINTTTRALGGTFGSVNLTVNITVNYSYSGTFYWNYFARDSLNNGRFNETNFTLYYSPPDTTPPVVTINLPVNAQVYNSSSLNFNVSLDENGTVRYSLNWGVTNYTMSSTNNRNFNATNSSIGDGSYTFKVYANDSVGNANNGEYKYFSVDTLYPGVNIVYPANDLYYNVNVSSLNYSYSDANPSKCWYTNNSGAWNSTTVNAGINFTVSTIEGRNNFTVYCNDSFGHLNYSSTSFVKDTIKPAVSISYPQSARYNYLVSAINYSASDLGSGLDSEGACSYICLNQDYHGMPPMGIGGPCNNFTGINGVDQGNNTCTVYVEDLAGNTNSSNVTFFVDSIAPRVNISYPQNATYNYAVSALNYSVFENGSGLNASSCRYTIDSGFGGDLIHLESVFGPCNNFTGMETSEGSNMFTVTARDVIGNLNSSSVTFVVDTTAPAVNLIAPGNATTVNNSIVSFNATFSDSSGLSNATFYLWNSSLSLINTTASTIGGISGSVNLTVVLPYGGTFYWNYFAVDSASNSAFNSTNFTLVYSSDTTPPVVTINLPAAEAYYNSSSLNFNVSLDENGTVRYSLNGGITNYTMSSTNNRNFNATNSSIGDGSYMFSVYANDTAGNNNYSASVRFVVDRTKPLISYGTGTENNGEVSDVNWVYVNVSVTETNENAITFKLYNGSGAINVSSFTDRRRAMNWTGLSVGTYYYNVTVNDSAGNFNSTATRTMTLINSSCLNANCSEGSDCSVTSACVLHNGLCTGEICDFRNFVVGANIYTLYDSAGNGRSLTLNLSGNITFLAGGWNITFSGKNGTGGSAGTLNITVPGLFNTTNARFYGIGGYSATTGVAGGNGGRLQLNYHGLIGKFTDDERFPFTPSNTPVLTAGSSASAGSGTNGAIVYNKNSMVPRDADVNGDGVIDGLDVGAVKDRYNNVMGDGSFMTSADIGDDGKINVLDLYPVGFGYNTR
jgi:alpha-tubulin suppressor-like RCC1 family protein